MGFIRENILKILTIFVVFIVIIVVCMVAFGGDQSKDILNYSSMENNLVTSAKKYINKNSNLIPENNGEITKINLDTLVNSEYIDELRSIEDENVKCSGYVQVINNNNIYNYVPYIKCGKYYQTQLLADYIKNNYVEVIGEDGLYKIEDTYVYKGEKPKNYITLGNRMYRIIEINKNNEIKLISLQKYNSHVVWDDRYNIERDRNDGINDYSKSRLKDSLANVYNDTEFFSEQEKGKIIEHNICIGKRFKTDTSMDGLTECSIEYPNQRVGLLQLNEYARASIDPNCNSINSKACSNYNYFQNISSTIRTITAVADNTYQVYYINNGIPNIAKASNSFAIYPVIYIGGSSIYSSGDGTLENPYVVR